MIQDTRPHPIGNKSHETLIKYVKWFYSHVNRSSWRRRLMLIDEGYYASDMLLRDDKALREWRVKQHAVGLDYELPVTYSQVEAAAGYLGELYLSGYPLFPVVGDQRYVEEIKQMSTLIENHAVTGKYALEFVNLFNDLGKYNQGTIDLMWWPGKVMSFHPDPNQPGAVIPQSDWEFMNRLARVDPYNLIYDTSPLRQHRVSYDSEYIGHGKLVRRIELLKVMEALTAMNQLTNYQAALNSTTVARDGTSQYWEKPPMINPDAYNYSTNDQNTTGGGYWSSVFQPLYSAPYKFDTENYLLHQFSVFIVPKDFALKEADDMSVQCWRLIVVNMSVVIACFRTDTADFSHTILHSNMSSDGFGLQTKSIGEWSLPIQDIASDLLNTLLAANRRAIADRAIYNPAYIDPAHFNNADPAPQIPMREGTNMRDVKPSDAYYPAPYNMRGVEGIMPTMERLLQVTDMIGGTNRLDEGRMVKGNRSATEVTKLDQSSNRMQLLAAIVTEYGIMAPLRNTIKWNILTKQSPVTLLNRVLLQEVNVDPAQLRTILMDFQVLSGFNPRQRVVEADIASSTMNLGLVEQQQAQQAQLNEPAPAPAAPAPLESGEPQ